jgi:hypothetical protein
MPDVKDPEGRTVRREYLDARGKILSYHDCREVGCSVSLDGQRLRPAESATPLEVRVVI